VHVEFYSSGPHQSAHRVVAYYYATAVSYYVTLFSVHSLRSTMESFGHMICPSACSLSLSLSEVMSVAQKRLVSLDSRIFGRGTCGCETKVRVTL